MPARLGVKYGLTAIGGPIAGPIGKLIWSGLWRPSPPSSSPSPITTCGEGTDIEQVAAVFN